MTRIFSKGAARLLPAALVFAAASVCAAPAARGQEAQPQQQPAQSQQAAAAAAPADEPLYVEFKGVKLGATREEARKQLGRPQQSDASQDFFVFSERARARVYYDDKGVVTAVIVTYIGKSANAPTPQAILGSEVEAKQDGSVYKMVRYPKAGYWVAYSRTTGDEPLTMITMQKM